MNIQLKDHFTYGKLLRFTLPSMVMMIFTSAYGIVDGYFVSNFAGKIPFTAVNLIMPVLIILGTLGFMFGTGGSALVAKTLGAGEPEKANRLFSLLVYTSIVLGIVIAGLGIVLLRPVALLLGAKDALLDDCVLYGKVILAALPAYILQMEFQSFFSTAEKPQLGLWITVAAGLTNMVLDAMFIAVFRWGVAGAALATVVGQILGGVIPLIYFARPNSSLLRLGSTQFDGRAIVRTCTNGSSELMSSVSMSLVSMLYNAQLMKYVGGDGVAAYGVLMYVSMIFSALFIGYSVGSAPVVSYHFGAQTPGELRGILKQSLVIISVFAVCMLFLAEGLAQPLARLFVGYDAELLALTLRGFRIFSFSFLFAGFSIFGSSFFTALSDGLTSALISFLRTLLFQMGAVLIFPLIWDVDGIWLSIVAAEAMAVAVTAVFLGIKRKQYGY